jgi:hypothetical protein
MDCYGHCRSLQLDEASACSIDQTCHECMECGGVLLVQPEHLLLFQLMVLDQSIVGKTAVAEILSCTQAFFDISSRDIGDGSDENFNVKFELIYTIGSQRSAEAGPGHWIHIDTLLVYVRGLAEQVMERLPLSMMRQDAHPGVFPYLRILRVDARRLLEELIAKKVYETGFRVFPIDRQLPHVRNAVYIYMTKWYLTEHEAALVESSDSDSFLTESVKPTLHSLRGLIAGGVLVFGLLRKRWCANYGLDPQRTPATRLAVP